MKTIFIFILVFFNSILLNAQEEFEDKFFFLKVQVDDGGQAYVINDIIHLNFGDTGLIYPIFHEKKNEWDQAIGIGIVTNPDQGSSWMDMVFLEGDKRQMIEERHEGLLAIKVSIPKIEEHSVFFELLRLNILLQDVYGDHLFYSYKTLLSADSKELETTILDALRKDLVLTASAMRKQMKSPMISNGSLKGQPIFDVMEFSTNDDLLDFVEYMIARPALYRGGIWKISEVYATWLDSGSPKVIK